MASSEMTVPVFLKQLGDELPGLVQEVNKEHLVEAADGSFSFDIPAVAAALKEDMEKLLPIIESNELNSVLLMQIAARSALCYSVIAMMQLKKDAAQAQA